MTSVLEGRVALVTGGDSGIGAACAVALAQSGADVAVLYHSDDDGSNEVVGSIERVGRRALAIKGDVGDEADVERAFDQIVAAFGPVDILVNSAGLNMSATKLADMSLEQWDRVIRTDLTGSFLASRRFVRDRKGREGPAAIINITSIHDRAMRAGGADYGAAKGAQRNLTRTLAIEVAEQKITVNAIAPGMILTPMNQEEVEDKDKRREAERHIPLGRAGTPEEVARVALFLADPASAYITGATITIDGGLSLMQALGA
jgi:glucose 1-dehydrogenase